LTFFFGLMNFREKGEIFSTKPSLEESSLPPKEEQGVCGNSLCEPDFGENRENCLQDCSKGD
jgi:hypothetical protein